MIRNKCRQNPAEWHDWFAWYPVRVDERLEGDRFCWTVVWLSTVRRRLIVHTWDISWLYELKS